MNKECILPKPEFEKLFTATIELGDEYALGETGRGYSEITPVTGGTAAGIINGSILPFGGDWGLLHSETVNMLDTNILSGQRMMLMFQSNVQAYSIWIMILWWL